MIRAKLNIQDQDGSTALLVACYLKYDRIIDGIAIQALQNFGTLFGAIFDTCL